MIPIWMVSSCLYYSLRFCWELSWILTCLPFFIKYVTLMRSIVWLCRPCSQKLSFLSLVRCQVKFREWPAKDHAFWKIERIVSWPMIYKRERGAVRSRLHFILYLFGFGCRGNGLLFIKICFLKDSIFLILTIVSIATQFWACTKSCRTHKLSCQTMRGKNSKKFFYIISIESL